MRHLALGASGELSPTSSKPRNKLGYHRTSVACGKQPTRSFLALTWNRKAYHLLKVIVDEGKYDACLPWTIQLDAAPTVSV